MKIISCIHEVQHFFPINVDPEMYSAEIIRAGRLNLYWFLLRIRMAIMGDKNISFCTFIEKYCGLNVISIKMMNDH